MEQNRYDKSVNIRFDYSRRVKTMSTTLVACRTAVETIMPTNEVEKQ